VKTLRWGVVLIIAVVVVACGRNSPVAPTSTSSALAGVGAEAKPGNTPGQVIYSGQGLTADGFGGYDLNQEVCGVENGAEVNGPYLLWVLTAFNATTASITGPWGTATMTQSGNGAFKYVSGWYAPATLPGNVSATFNGTGNAQLVISHGCRPSGNGWCSPGFWRNADDAAWALTGHTKSDLFNTTVYPLWYGATFGANPTLQTVLNNPQTYSGPPWAGTLGFALNAYNATGAMLTDAIPGFHFDWNTMISGSSEACPIDSHGNLK
jgi:hypothetical protein